MIQPMFSANTALSLVLLLPFLATVLVAILPRRLAELVSLVAALATFFFAVQLLSFFNQEQSSSIVLGELISD